MRKSNSSINDDLSFNLLAQFGLSRTFHTKTSVFIYSFVVLFGKVMFILWVLLMPLISFLCYIICDIVLYCGYLVSPRQHHPQLLLIGPC